MFFNGIEGHGLKPEGLRIFFEKLSFYEYNNETAKYDNNSEVNDFKEQKGSI